MIRTWLIAPIFPFGGAERQMHEVAKLSSDDIALVDMKSAIKERHYDGAQVIGLDNDVLHLHIKNKVYRRFKRYLSLYKLYKKIKEKKISQVVFYNPIFLSLAFVLSFTNVKVIFSVREYKGSLFKGVSLICLKRVDVLFTNTTRVKNKLSELNTPCRLVLNTIMHIPLVDHNDRVEETVLVISNLEPHKNLHFLLKSTKNMSFKINVAGKISNQEYYRRCKAIAEESNCEVSFLGSISQKELNQQLLRTSCLIHPSLIEGTSNAILDAINTSTPLLVADIPENSYLVDDLDSFLFSVDDELQLERKITSLLNTCPPQKYKQQQAYLKNRLETKFSKENISELVKLLSFKELN